MIATRPSSAPIAREGSRSPGWRTSRPSTASLFYDDQGDGQAVVLLHGFAADVNID